MTSRRNARRAVFDALDVLTRGGVWSGNVREVWNMMCRQGHSWVSDYMIRQVLRDYGEELGRGQYKVKSESLTAGL